MKYIMPKCSSYIYFWEVWAITLPIFSDGFHNLVYLLTYGFMSNACQCFLVVKFLGHHAFVCRFMAHWDFIWWLLVGVD